MIISMKALRKYFEAPILDNKGAAAVEFSLVLPIYIGSIFFLIETARMVYTQSATLYAAEQATRYAVVNFNASDAEIQAKATDNILGLDKDNLGTVIVTTPLDVTTNTKTITVTVQFNYVPILPVHKLFGKDIATNGFRLSSSSAGFLTEEEVTGT